MYRVGIGQDLHRLVRGRRFILGGVELPFDKGEDAHSDGDVLCHAIIDALLGAAGAGDIGELFPARNAQYKDACSLTLLSRAWEKLFCAGWSIVNIDAVVCAESPALLPYREKICANIAQALGINATQVFVKGKTGEKVGVIGEGLAVEASAVCLLEKAET